jgi:hypothetical protein
MFMQLYNLFLRSVKVDTFVRVELLGKRKKREYVAKVCFNEYMYSIFSGRFSSLVDGPRMGLNIKDWTESICLFKIW